MCACVCKLGVSVSVCLCISSCMRVFIIGVVINRLYYVWLCACKSVSRERKGRHGGLLHFLPSYCNLCRRLLRAPFVPIPASRPFIRRGFVAKEETPLRLSGCGLPLGADATNKESQECHVDHGTGVERLQQRGKGRWGGYSQAGVWQHR